jgi:hypothetical protein
MTDDLRAAIHSGLTIKLVYTVDLRRYCRRLVATARSRQPWWPQRSVYDTLTRRYHVSRTLDGHIDWAEIMSSEGGGPGNALTNDFARLSLFRGLALEPNAEYYVRGARALHASQQQRSSGPGRGVRCGRPGEVHFHPIAMPVSVRIRVAVCCRTPDDLEHP